MTEAIRVPNHRPVLDQAQGNAYQARGYLTLKGMLDDALLGRLSHAIDRLWEEARLRGRDDPHFDLEPAHSAENPRMRRISSPTELDDVFIEVAFHSVLGDIAADLLGGAVKFYHSKVNFKLPEGGAEIGWHQDWPVFPHTNTDLLAISVPLNPSHRGNGCLRTISGSHHGGPRSHWHDGRYVLNCNASVSEDEIAGAEHNEAEPGDVLVHHGLVVHGSGANLSDQIRTTYIIQYAAADAFAYTAPVIDSRHRNRMVRGEPARHARVEAGVIELPPDFSDGYGSIYAHQESDRNA
jgi:hypothetical protein